MLPLFRFRSQVINDMCTFTRATTNDILLPSFLHLPIHEHSAVCGLNILHLQGTCPFRTGLVISGLLQLEVQVHPHARRRVENHPLCAANAARNASEASYVEDTWGCIGSEVCLNDAVPLLSVISIDLFQEQSRSHWLLLPPGNNCKSCPDTS